MRPRYRLLGSALAGAALFVACDRTKTDAPGAAAVIEVRDYTDRAVTLQRPAKRVLSLMPAVTDLLLAMGAGDRLLARTRFDTDPRIAHLETTGNALMPSVEWIASLQPDLVITWPDQPSHPVLSLVGSLGIATYAARTDRIEDVLRITRDLGRLVGLSRAADSLAIALGAQLDSVRQAVAGAPTVRVLYALSLDPPMAAGPGTYIDELITLAGGTNTFSDVRTLWPQVNLEEILHRRPEAIIVAGEENAAGADRLAKLAGWRELDAVRRGRVLQVDPNLFNRPGANLPLAARALATFLHPDRFPAAK